MTSPPKQVSLTPAVFHLPPEVNAVAGPYALNPIVPRGPALRPVLERIQRRLPQALGCAGTHQPILLACSGSGAVAAALGGCVDERGILIVANGAYGERQVRYARQMGLRVTSYPLEYGERPDPARVEALARESGVGALSLVHGATSTCSLNPVDEIGQVARRLGLRFIVDGIASVFAEELDLGRAHIDVLVASANKGLHSHPGLAFVLVSREALEDLLSRPSRVPYLDLAETWRAQSTASHPYTINVRALLELEGALDALDREGGVPGRVAIYRQRVELLRAGYAELGLEIFRRSEMPLQNIGTALHLPEGARYEELAAALAAWDDGSGEHYTIYSAQGKLSDSVFRIFNMGDYELDTYRRFLHALGAVLAG